MKKLERAQEKAVQAGVNLEWNFYKHQTTVTAVGGRLRGGAEVNIRVAGFLKALVSADPRGVSFVKYLINKGFSGRGFNSPATNQSWIAQAVVNHGSPEAINRRALRIRKRANEILRGYGLRVSNASLTDAVTSRSHTHKAGKAAAAETLKHILIRAFGADLWGRKKLDIFLAARGFAEAIKLPKQIRLKIGNTFNRGEIGSLREGIEFFQQFRYGFCDLRTRVEVHGITVCRAIMDDEDEGEKWLVIKGERSFFADVNRYDYDRQLRVNFSPRECVKLALDLWRSKARKNKLFLRHLQIPQNVSLLVWKDDIPSDVACRCGMEEFLSEDLNLHPSTPFVPFDVLVSHRAKNYRIDNIIGVAARVLLEQIQGRRTSPASA